MFQSLKVNCRVAASSWQMRSGKLLPQSKRVKGTLYRPPELLKQPQSMLGNNSASCYLRGRRR